MGNIGNISNTKRRRLQDMCNGRIPDGAAEKVQQPDGSTHTMIHFGGFKIEVSNETAELMLQDMAAVL